MGVLFPTLGLLLLLLLVPSSSFLSLSPTQQHRERAKRLQAVVRKRNNRPKGQGRSAQNRRRGELIRGLTEPAPPTQWSAASEDPVFATAKAACRAADGRKAQETVAYFVKPLTDVASFVVLANGRSKPQNDAIAAAVVEDLDDTMGRLPDRVDGGADGGWTVLDYGDLIVHVMTPLSRQYYNLDAFWTDRGAPQLDLSDVLTPDYDLPLLTDDDLDSNFFDVSDFDDHLEGRDFDDDDDDQPGYDDDGLPVSLR